MALCECGCGLEAKPGNRFIYQHHLRGKKLPPRSMKHCAAIAKSKIGVLLSPDHCVAISKSHLGLHHSPEQCIAISKGRLNSDKCKTAYGEMRDVPKSPDHCAAISKSLKGVLKSPAHCAALSEAGKHAAHSPTRNDAISKALKGVSFTPEHCAAVSESKKGENNPNWKGGISRGKYCPKFNEKLKRYIRDKYNNCDYISGISACVCNVINEKVWQLDVHHIDYNKQQGCDDHEWRLIPLSKKNHIKTNVNRDFWNRLFTYSLQYDEIYYEI